MIATTRERPIAFKPPLVRAIRAKGKTQTRRIMKPQPVRIDERTYHWHPPRAKFNQALGHETPLFVWRADRNPLKTGAASIVEYCPYGVPGDALWVREALVERDGAACYESDGSVVQRPEGGPLAWAWKVRKLSARYMPRRAARTFLCVTRVRAEPLNEISEEDAIAEGFGLGGPVTAYGLPPSPRDGFFLYWDLINGAGSLDANPWVWVWVVDFEPIEGGSST